jgi:hypothetical protein
MDPSFASHSPFRDIKVEIPKMKTRGYRVFFPGSQLIVGLSKWY